MKGGMRAARPNPGGQAAALAVALLFATPAQAWEGDCQFDGHACKGDGELAFGTYGGEHRALCVRAINGFGLPQEITGNWKLVVPTQSKDNRLPTRWTEASYVDSRFYSPCGFAELPDFSWSLDDWSAAHQLSCPVATLPLTNCRSFPAMGPYNSTHFGAQAQVMYAHYHGLALDHAETCRLMAATAERLKQRGYTSIDVPAQTALRECDLAALSLEGVGQHYLQDLWSVGHMWDRWGGPRSFDVIDPTTGLLTAIAAGTIHGAKSLTGFDDAMCSPTNGVEWGLAGDGSNARHPGVGDLHLQELLNDARFRTQRDMLLGCSAAGFAEVYGAGGQSMGPAPPSSALRGMYPSARCAGPGATHRALREGLAFTVPIGGIPVSLPWTEIGGLELPQGIAESALLRFQVDYTRIAAQVETAALIAPDALTLALGETSRQGYRSPLYPFMGVPPNSQLQSDAPAHYLEPRGPWPVPEDSAGLERVRYLRRAFHEGHLATWCDEYTWDDLTALRSACVASGGNTAEPFSVCGLCIEAVRRKTWFARVGASCTGPPFEHCIDPSRCALTGEPEPNGNSLLVGSGIRPPGSVVAVKETCRMTGRVCSLNGVPTSRVCDGPDVMVFESLNDLAQAFCRADIYRDVVGSLGSVDCTDSSRYTIIPGYIETP